MFFKVPFFIKVLRYDKLKCQGFFKKQANS